MTTQQSGFRRAALAPAQSPANIGATSETKRSGADAAYAVGALPDERPSENAEGKAIRRNAADNQY